MTSKNVKNDTYHRRTFKSKPVIKKEYADLVKFCDQLLLGEDKLKKEIVKLETAVNILNQQIKEDRKKDHLEAYRQGQQDFIEDLISKFPHIEREMLSLLE